MGKIFIEKAPVNEFGENYTLITVEDSTGSRHRRAFNSALLPLETGKYKLKSDVDGVIFASKFEGGVCIYLTDGWNKMQRTVICTKWAKVIFNRSQYKQIQDAKGHYIAFKLERVK